MNVAVINLKDISKYIFKILIAIFILYISTQYISNSGKNLKQIISNNVSNEFLTKCLRKSIPFLNKNEAEEEKTFTTINLMQLEIAMLNPEALEIRQTTVDIPKINEENETNTKPTESPHIEIPKTADTEKVTNRNFEPGSNFLYGTTKIDNESKYTITKEMLDTNVEITNKKDVLIFHTHTSESYTPCDTYNYTMTGNYRTTDSNYNMLRVGKELATHLTKKGFNVVHDGTYHDYPAYSGSYSRSLETVENLLEKRKADIVIDLHRDAVGNGDTYGPTVMINGESVAQLMFVIGTDGGGSTHPNWLENLKIAIMIQEKANEMYPGLFRPIIVRNSRYNQHVAKGACIIEVGATANTLGETMLSMQCLANVLEEVCK